jgi:hypothetical protein
MKISIIHSSHKRKVQQLRQLATDLQLTSSEIPKKLGNQQHCLIQIPKIINSDKRKLNEPSNPN